MNKTTKILNFSASAICLFAALISLNMKSYILSIATAALIHEIGHIVAAILLGIKVQGIHFDSLGAVLKIDSETHSYYDEFLLSAAGPFANLALSMLLAFFLKSPAGDVTSSFLFYLWISSNALAVFNLLPIKNIDGGRMLYCFLCLFISERWAFYIIQITSFLFIFIMWSMSVYVILKVGDKLPAFFFSITLFARIFIDDANQQNLKNPRE